jgi:hypothetical protein
MNEYMNQSLVIIVFIFLVNFIVNPDIEQPHNTNINIDIEM